MTQASTLYRFRIEVSDIDRGVYQPLDFRVAMHPSETATYLLTRVLAYALNIEEGLDFSPGGLSDTDEPCLRTLDLTGGLMTWIEVGNPTAKKLHKATKAARRVKIYTYKDPELLLREMSAGHIHRVEEIEIFSFRPLFLNSLADTLKRDNRWSLVHTEGALTVSMDNQAEQGEVFRHRLSDLRQSQ